jgi:PAS domain S-box-containing protein
MFKTVKSKITIVYQVLVYTIAIVGLASIVNIYSLSKSIDGLMVNNYKSINAVTNMMEAIEEQKNAIFTYIYVNREDGINNFHHYSSVFDKWYTIEYNNITESGEFENVKIIKDNYEKISLEFSHLQNVLNTEGLVKSVNYYDTTLSPLFNDLKEELKKLSELNESAMFHSKGRVTEDAQKSMYIIIFLSTISVVGGYIISRYSTNKTLRPIYSLTETIKSIKEGNLAQEAPILSEDEIGDLTVEFNNMTKRLQSFEQSTLGKLFAEKNKSITIVKSIGDPLIVLDRNYKILLINDACEKLFDINESETVNKHFLEYIRNGGLYDFIYNASKSQSQEPKQKIIYLDVHGDPYYFNVIVTVIKDLEASINGIVVLLQNVTQLKQLEKLKSEFISTVSHEFKTPLTSIMMGATLIQSERIGGLNQKQKDIVQTIKEDSDQLNLLVNNLLQISKIESKKAVFNTTPCSISKVILPSIKLFHDQAKSKGVILNYKVNESLPEVIVDEDKVPWIINNLISNALKFTNFGDSITIDSFIAEDKMCISVQDTGIGIPEEYQGKIFDRFMQVKGNDSEIRGTGLGLAISKEIVEALGGEIWCTSTLGSGSNFTFTLPLARPKLN